MLYVQEKVVKLGGVYLGGQVTSVEIQEAGSVYVAQDEKGRFKKSQPVGYENGKVMVDILLEATKSASTLEQLTEMQRLFKPYGQSKPKLLPIVNEDCAARGITKVYFKKEMRAMGGACLTSCRESMMTSCRWRYSSVSAPNCPRGNI